MSDLSDFGGLEIDSAIGRTESELNLNWFTSNHLSHEKFSFCLKLTTFYPIAHWSEWKPLRPLRSLKSLNYFIRKLRNQNNLVLHDLHRGHFPFLVFFRTYSLLLLSSTESVAFPDELDEFTSRTLHSNLRKQTSYERVKRIERVPSWNFQALCVLSSRLDSGRIVAKEDSRAFSSNSVPFETVQQAELFGSLNSKWHEITQLGTL